MKRLTIFQITMNGMIVASFAEYDTIVSYGQRGNQVSYSFYRRMPREHDTFDIDQLELYEFLFAVPSLKNDYLTVDHVAMYKYLVSFKNRIEFETAQLKLPI